MKRGTKLVLATLFSGVLGACGSLPSLTGSGGDTAKTGTSAAWQDGCTFGRAEGQYPEFGQPVRRVPDSPETRQDWQAGYDRCFAEIRKTPRFVSK